VTRLSGPARERPRRVISKRVRERCSAEEAQRRELVIAAYASGLLRKQKPSPWLREQVMHGGGGHRAKGGISSAPAINSIAWT
jgi:hypothetical protein